MYDTSYPPVVISGCDPSDPLGGNYLINCPSTDDNTCSCGNAFPVPSTNPSECACDVSCDLCTGPTNDDCVI